MQSLENQIWRSRLASMKLKLYNTCILPIFLYGSDCWAISKTDAHKIDALDQWCLRMLLGIKWYQLWCTEANKATQTHCYNPVAPAYPVWAYYAHGRQRRYQEDPVSIPSGRLEKTTRSSPASCGSAPSNRIWNSTTLCSQKQQIWLRTALLEDDVDVWRYAILELHARNDDNDDSG